MKDQFYVLVFWRDLREPWRYVTSHVTISQGWQTPSAVLFSLGQVWVLAASPPVYLPSVLPIVQSEWSRD